MTDQTPKAPDGDDRLPEFLTIIMGIFFRDQDLTWSGARNRLIYLAIIFAIMVIIIIVVFAH